MKKLSETTHYVYERYPELKNFLKGNGAIKISREYGGWMVTYPTKIEWYRIRWVPNYRREAKPVARFYLKSGRFQFSTERSDRTTVNRNIPLQVWEYGHKTRIGLWKWFFEHRRHTGHDICKEFPAFQTWEDKSNRVSYNPCGQWVATEDEACLSPTGIIYGAQPYVPRSVSGKPKPKPRSTIPWRELVAKLPAVYGIACMLQDKKLQKVVGLFPAYYGTNTEYTSDFTYTPFHYIVDALFPHLQVFFPKMTKRNIHDAIRTMRDEKHSEIYKAVWTPMAKEYPNMVRDKW